MTEDERSNVECSATREALSSRMDGELLPSSNLDASIDRHLSQCTGCQRWEEQAWTLRRAVNVRLSPIVDHQQLTTALMARMSVPEYGRNQWIRYLLGVVAGVLIAIHAPPLLSLFGAADHDARHLGAFGVSLGMGLLWAAVRPERAIGLIPVAAALAGTMLATSTIDLLSGRATMLAESTHIVEVAGLALVWWLSGGRRRLVGRLDKRHRSVPLRSV